MNLYCKNGHRRKSNNTYIRPNGNIECRICKRIKKTNTPKKRRTREEIFWLKVRRTDTCWIYTGHKDKNNYGLFHNGKTITAHRFSYQLEKGFIPFNFEVHHKCKNPICVNPNHLEAMPRELHLMQPK